MDLMLNKTTNNISPLCLALACNELRVFGNRVKIRKFKYVKNGKF